MELSTYKIAMIGLGPMGRNLALNLKDKGIDVVGYDPDQEARRRADNEGIRICPSLKLDVAIEHIAGASACWIMVPDTHIDQALRDISLLFPPDGKLTIIDGGNSHFKETERRAAWASEHNYPFLGIGVSGGEEGAGPCLMPGGDERAYVLMRSVLEAIAAKADGEPCVRYMGPGGAGHFVKIVQNGIEYAIMQAIGETYHLLRDGLDVSTVGIKEFFSRADGNRSLGGFLTRITKDILDTDDEKTGNPLIYHILDNAGQKGTGKWTSQIAYDLGVPVPNISAALNARFMSARKQERVIGAQTIRCPDPERIYRWPEWLPLVAEGLSAAMAASYAQGLEILKAGSAEYKYDLNLWRIAHIWKGGCIISSDILAGIENAVLLNPSRNLLCDPQFNIANQVRSLREVLTVANQTGVPTPVLNATRDYIDTLRSADLPSASLIQAQRDYFGAHTYQRKDREGTYHTEWGKEGRPEIKR